MSLRRRIAADARQCHRAAGSSPAPPGGPSLPDLAEAPGQAHAARFVGTRFSTMVRRLPALTGEALRTAWRANRSDTTLVFGLTAVSGVLTAFGLLATRNVLAALFTAGPTPGRVRAAVPALFVVAVAVGMRSGLSIAAGWAQARLAPRVNQRMESRLLRMTTRVELAAFDDPGFADDMERARGRGTAAAGRIVHHTINLTTGAVGVAAAAVTLVVLHPLLLAALLVASLPYGWAAVRVAHVEYESYFERAPRSRRRSLLTSLMASRQPAAELRAYTIFGFLLSMVAPARSR